MTGLIRRDPSSLRSLFPRFPFGLFRDDFDTALSRWDDMGDQWASQMLNPSLDVTESENSIDVSMDIPGMKADDIDIQVMSDVLTISGERNEQKEDKNGQSFHRIERHMGQFSRSIRLPNAVDQSKVEAVYDNGVLKIHLPKSEETKPRKFKVTEKKREDVFDSHQEHVSDKQNEMKSSESTSATPQHPATPATTH